jgi:hypothetical protein
MSHFGEIEFAFQGGFGRCVVWKYAFVGLALVACHLGCRDNSPETPRVPVAAPGRDSQPLYEPGKPLPAEARDPQQLGPAPFSDDPLVIDIPAEAKAFVDVYKQVGKPRIVVFVNRGLDGQILPVTDAGRYQTSKDIYLRPGQYDEVRAKQIDYEMMEVLLADWMSADNKVTILSPHTVHRQLTEQQQKDLQAGNPQALNDVGRHLDADVLIQVQAKPTRQTLEGLEVRVIAEAINIKGGESLARAAVDVQPPLDKIQTNRYTRFLARKLMDGMTSTWSTPAPAKKPE